MKYGNNSHLGAFVQVSRDIRVSCSNYFYSDSSQVRVRGQPGIVSRCSLSYACRTGCSKNIAKVPRSTVQNVQRVFWVWPLCGGD